MSSGLISPQAYASANVPFYTPAGAATGVITSPLIVKSADTTKDLTLSIENNGDCQITNFSGAGSGNFEIESIGNININTILGTVNLNGSDLNISSVNPTGVLRGDTYLDIISDDNLNLQTNLGAIEMTSAANITMTSVGDITLDAAGNDINLLSRLHIEARGSNNGLVELNNGTGATVPNTITFYNANQTGDGLSSGHLQIYSNLTGGSKPLLDLYPSGQRCDVGSLDVVGGTVLNVAGTSGFSRVYDATYNPPPAPSLAIGSTISTWSGTFGSTSGVVINNFEIPKTGNYLLQLRMTSGIGGSALNLNGTAPQEGLIFSITDVTVAPGDPDERSYLAIPYSTLVAQQALDGSAAGAQIILSVIIPYNAGRILDVIYTPTGAPTGGLLAYDIIQMC